MKACKCGCGQAVSDKKAFVNKEHQLQWMVSGGAREMNALQPIEAKEQGGRVAGQQALESGRLEQAAQKGGARSHEIAAQFRAAQDQGRTT